MVALTKLIYSLKNNLNYDSCGLKISHFENQITKKNG